MNDCTIVMYHYVRDLVRTRYSKIKGLQVSAFKEQLLYLANHYQFVKVSEILQALYAGRPLPKDAVLLTFDDGYLDHYTNVFPLLEEMGIQGCFFVPVLSTLREQVLAVNKIHFILACSPDVPTLVQDIFESMRLLRRDYGLKDEEWYFEKLAVKGRFDSREVVFIKRLLQVELEEEPRNILVNKLFSKYVSLDERAFASELYMSMDQIRLMTRHGMYIGGHGYSHSWLNTLSPAFQEEEIKRTVVFLKEAGVSLGSWVFSAPYGAYNSSLVEILQQNGCRMAVSIKPGTARLNRENAFSLERLDTNDLPKTRNGFKN